ncbi:succinylglutamate desuccinylase/aspartoacylase family protein, partial [Pseudoalteromonas sp. SIMBA_148]
HTQYDDATLKSNFKPALIAEVDSKLNGPAYLLNTGKRIALNLQTLAHQADIVLDLHTGPISSKPLYCPTSATDSARYFNLEPVL